MTRWSTFKWIDKFLNIQWNNMIATLHSFHEWLKKILRISKRYFQAYQRQDENIYLVKDPYVIFIILLPRKVFNLKMKPKSLIIILKEFLGIYIISLLYQNVISCTCPFSPCKLIPGIFHDPAYFYLSIFKRLWHWKLSGWMDSPKVIGSILTKVLVTHEYFCRRKGPNLAHSGGHELNSILLAGSGF